MSDTIEVFFATNRDHLPDERPPFGTTFHREGAAYYRVGKAVVTNSDGGYKLSHTEVAAENAAGGDDTDPDVKLGSRAIFAEIKRRMREDGRDLIVLIHGFAADFETAPERAAELAEKYLIAGKDGQARRPVVFAFSWPANGRSIPFVSYISDRGDAARSGDALARLFLRLCDFLVAEARENRRQRDEAARERHAPCPNRIHLVAHSMGNWTLRHGLQGLIAERGADRLPSVFDNIFLMAADEDADALADPAKLALLPRLGNAVHVYHSKDDRALVISDTTKLNPDRLGQMGPKDMDAVDEKVIAVDCRHVDSTEFLHANHQYYRLREAVIADVRQVLAGLAPGEIDGRTETDHPNRYIIARPGPE